MIRASGDMRDTRTPVVRPGSGSNRAARAAQQLKMEKAMNFSYNWNDVYPRALYCGDGPYGTSCAETYGFWGRNDATRPRAVDRENRAADKLIGGDQWSLGKWRSRNFLNGRGSAAAKIQELLNRAMRDARARGASGVPASLTVDGILGNASHAAIVWYQKRVGLNGDGLVGNATWQKLRYA